MVRLFWCFVGLALVGCSPLTAVEWVTPRQGEVLSGKVAVEVRALGETPAPNAIFYADGKQVGKVALDSEGYSFIWDTQQVSPGFHVLEVRPFGEVGSRLKVEVSRTTPPNETPSPTPSDLSIDDPFNINTWFEFIPELRDVYQSVPAFDLNDIYPRVETTFRLLAAEPLLLPRGIYTYDNGTQDWTFEPHDEDSFQATLSFEDADARTHDVIVSATYNATEMVSAGATMREVPNAFDLLIEDNGEVVAEGTFNAVYTTPEGCIPQLEPTEAALDFVWFGFDGGLGGQDPLLEETTLSVSTLFSDERIDLALTLSALRENDSSGEPAD